VSEPLPEPSPATAVPAADTLVRAKPLVVVLSVDLALLQSMDEARIAGQFIGVASLERFVDQLVSGSVAVAIIDCSLVPEPTGEFMLGLRDQFPCLALIAAGDVSDQSSISGLIADGTVCRFVHKPASHQRLELFVEAGLRRHAALLSEQPARELGTPFPAARSPRRRFFTALLVAAVLGVGLYFYWHYYEGPSTAIEPEPAVIDTQPATAATVADDSAPAIAPRVGEPISPQAKPLDQALQRMDDGALLEPAGDNAREYIDAANKLAPDDPQVRAAARRLGDLIIAAARKAIASGNSDDARHWLGAAADYHINPATIDWLRQQVDALDPPAAAAPAALPTAAAAPTLTTAAPPPTTTETSPATTEPPPAPAAGAATEPN
jgi:hypothetical protein